MEDCTKLATAVQNRPTVAKAVHGTIVMLMRLAQGQDSDIDHRTFHEIIGACTIFGAIKGVHSASNFLSTQAGKQQMPISANPGRLGWLQCLAEDLLIADSLFPVTLIPDRLMANGRHNL